MNHPATHTHGGTASSLGLDTFESTALKAVESGRLPGVAAMVADADSVLYSGAFGFADAVSHTPLAVDDVFFIASMSKAITSLACVQLIEQGKVSLDDDASVLVPQMNSRVLTGFDAAGQPVLRKPKHPVTVRHLLTHTSGQSTDIWNPDIVRYIEVMGLPPVPGCTPAAFDTPLVFDPGDNWEYGVGIDWIGQIVEKISGLRLNEYFRKFIFEPVGMNETSFILTPAQQRKLVPVHGRDEDGNWSILPFQVSQEPEFFMGGAGLYGTCGDYIKFLQMLINRGQAAGGRILKRETVDLFLANHIGDLEWPGMTSAIPAMSVDVTLFPGHSKKWSLGFLRNEHDIPGHRRAGSQFWAGLANSYFWVDPASGLAGVTASSFFPFADPTALDVFDALERDVYAAIE